MGKSCIRSKRLQKIGGGGAKRPKNYPWISSPAQLRLTEGTTLLINFFCAFPEKIGFTSSAEGKLSFSLLTNSVQLEYKVEWQP